MARRRFFVSEIRREVAEITGDDAAHLVRVLRVEAGQLFEISDNHQAWLAEVESARKASVVFRVKQPIADPAPLVTLRLCPALFKFDHFEWLIEKATELGVASIHPFNAARTDHGLFAASHKRLERWRRIGLEASQQSRRTHLPEIEPVVKSLDRLSVESGTKLFLDEARGAPIVSAISKSESVALLVGPEGGWTEEERAIAGEQQWIPVTLGPGILRAETAAIAALSIVNALYQC